MVELPLRAAALPTRRAPVVGALGGDKPRPYGFTGILADAVPEGVHRPRAYGLRVASFELRGV